MAKEKGIYRIRCLPSGKCYIGSSVHIQRRWKEHKADLRTGNHDNPYLQKAWGKHSEQAFVFEVVELVEDNLIALEIIWILLNRSNDKQYGFNLAHPDKHAPLLLETKTKIQQSTLLAFQEPVRRAKQIAHCKALHSNPEVNQKKSSTLKQFYKDNPESAQTRDALNRQRASNPQFLDRLEIMRNNQSVETRQKRKDTWAQKKARA